MTTLSTQRTGGKNEFSVIADPFLHDPGLPFASVLDAASIQRVFREEEALFGQADIFSTEVVLWAFLAQRLRDGKGVACSAAVAIWYGSWAVPLPPLYLAVAVETMARRRPTARIPRNLRATFILHLQLDRYVRQRPGAFTCQRTGVLGCALHYVPMLSLYHISRRASTNSGRRGHATTPPGVRQRKRPPSLAAR